jgi:hypothetical protein
MRGYRIRIVYVVYNILIVPLAFCPINIDWLDLRSASHRFPNLPIYLACFSISLCSSFVLGNI